jgi:hypothetical protein
LRAKFKEGILTNLVFKEGWRIRSNNELQELVKGEDVVKYIKSTNNKMVGKS